MQLIVVGFHRSGTSLLTQLLHRAGLFVGDDLLGAMPSNPYGHFEDREVLEIHRQILDDHGQGWQVDQPTSFHISATQWERMRAFAHKRMAAHRNWGFKEPRVCLFLGAWKYLLPEARFLVIYRDPGECVRSMESRHAKDYLRKSGPAEAHLRFFREPDHGLKVWDAYNRAVIAFARAHLEDCLVIPFTHLVQGYPVVREVNARFSGDLAEVATSAVFDADVTGARGWDQWVHDPAVGARVAQTWRKLQELTVLTGGR